MNAFTDIVFIFVFVFVILHFGLINVFNNDNIILQKTIMFVLVTIFATLLYVMKSIRRQKAINLWNSAGSGLIIGMLAFVGHTLLFDLKYMDSTKEQIEGITDNKYFTENVLLSLLIALTIAFGKSIIYIFAIENC